jgi:predicted amidohydrolase YtcJ
MKVSSAPYLLQPLERIPAMTSVFRNGRFYVSERLDDGKPSFVDCMVVRQGTIVHLGSSEDDAAKEAVNAGATVVDIKNQIVLPGFIDGHMHLLMLGMSLQKVSLEGCKTIDDIRSTIRTYAKANPSVPRILCRGWMHSMTNGEALASMLDDLDDRPIYIDSKDLHSTWSNSAALREMGIDSMPDPPGGTIHRGTNEKASGLLSEACVIAIVWPFLSQVSPKETKRDALRAGIEAYSAAGYTGMVEMAMDEHGWAALLDLRSESPRMRIAAHWLILPSSDTQELLKQVDRAIELHQLFNAEKSPNLRIAGIKVICDGVIDACTAALSQPYSTGETRGPLWNAEMLATVIERADRAGLQCALHAIGDAAIRLAVDSLEKHATPGRRHRIEHLELASSEDARRLGQLGITASIQAVHADPAILRAWPKLLGEHRCGRAFAYKEFQDHGAVLALGSDAPTAPHPALPNIYTATTRRSAREPQFEETVNPHFALPLASAIAAVTAGSAYSCFADAWTGRLAVGLKADFVVVDLEWEPEKLLAAKVLQTWFEGRQVFGL